MQVRTLELTGYARDTPRCFHKGVDSGQLGSGSAKILINIWADTAPEPGDGELTIARQIRRGGKPAYRADRVSD